MQRTIGGILCENNLYTAVVVHFKDIGIIISKKYLKEHSCILTVFTKEHGLYSGVVRESQKNKFIYQEGNIVEFFWKARLHEHIGSSTCELIKAYSGSLIHNKTKLYAFNSIIFLIKTIFHERERHYTFFNFLAQYIKELAHDFNFRKYIELELKILAEAGYRLILDRCAISSSAYDLGYVSPKSGMAVSSTIGGPYKDKLLILPQFLTANIENKITPEEKKQAFDLTSYFFSRYLSYNPKQVNSRQIFIEYEVARQN